ncbi:hypothetical protein C8R43DRAFT_1028814 [Mycena crocata]|nr:hypothetical protein C8R43DRAFT_1028814 [Mycena crocata]
MQLKTLSLPLLGIALLASPLAGVAPAAAFSLPALPGLPSALFDLSIGKYSHEVWSVLVRLFGKPDPEDFWPRARELGEQARLYGEQLMKDAAARSADARAKVDTIKLRVDAIVHAATAMHDELQASGATEGPLGARRVGDDENSKDENAVASEDTIKAQALADDLAHAFEAVFEELQVRFPAPDKAPGHAERRLMVRVALEKARAALLAVFAKYGMEERAKVHWDGVLEPAIEQTVVVLGDLAEQHPDLLSGILFTVAVLLIPESWILRPVLSVFGFGPTGPVKGTTAAWAQSTFYGAAVSGDSWFALLQWAGMTLRTPGVVGWLGGLFGSLAGGAALFFSCGGRK